MKKKLLLWLTVGSALLLSGCSSTFSSSYTSRVATIENRDIASSAMSADMEADFSKIVTAKSEPQQTKADAVLNAQYKCIMENKIDIIVDPIYKVTIVENGAKYVVELTGYAGYYKKAATSNPVEEMKNYKVEDIEKYKLLTDPGFYQYYYNKDSKRQGDVTNYYINGKGGSAPSSYYSVPEPAQEVKSSAVIRPSVSQQQMNNAMSHDYNYFYKKAKRERNAGISLTWIGMLVGAACGGCIAAIDDPDYTSKLIACSTLCGVGGLTMFAGTYMWCAGSAKMKQVRKMSNVAFNLGANSNGLGLGVTF